MGSLLWRQFRALVWKNFLVYRRHWLINLLRCLIFPIGFGIFLAYAPRFFSTPHQDGLGTQVPIFEFADHFDGSHPFVWSDESNGQGHISAQAIMNHVTANFSSKQLAGVRRLDNRNAVVSQCVTNFNRASGCHIAVAFQAIPSASEQPDRFLNYSLITDDRIYGVGVTRHDTYLETRVLPLQWAIDKAIIELTTGFRTNIPTQWPFTYNSDINVADNNRKVWLSIITYFGAFAFLLIFTGIVYQMTGSLSMERATGATSHMQAMGAVDTARILSWHLSMCALYLPAWIITAVVWKLRLFVHTNTGIVVLVHLLTGGHLASWSFFVSVWFAQSPHLAAVVASTVTILFAIIPIMLYLPGTGIQFILSLLFPSNFYVFALKAICAYELGDNGATLNGTEPEYNLSLGINVGAAVVGIVLWPCVSMLVDRALNPVASCYDKPIFKALKAMSSTTVPPGVAISLRGVHKSYNTSIFRRASKKVRAVVDLTVDIPTNGIFVLLGANGAGKTTVFSLLGGLDKQSSGEITFAGGVSRLTRGSVGIVPQTNILFSDLTCLESLIVWNAIKASETSEPEDLVQLLYDCDLRSKVHSIAETLSGGQKRKLQLAIGLTGGSKVILVDECTSGVDPLSRRAIWRTLTSCRGDRTILFSTHSLDEADFLADHIVVLAAPGKVVAEGTPVSLKSLMGNGYSIHVEFNAGSEHHVDDLFKAIRSIASSATLERGNGQTIYRLNTRDNSTTSLALHEVETRKDLLRIKSYDIVGTTVEDIFMGVVGQDTLERTTSANDSPIKPRQHLLLSTGRPRSPWAQATTVFHKRLLILRRSFIVPILALAIGISGAWWPIRYLDSTAATGCKHLGFEDSSPSELFPPRLWNKSVPVFPAELKSYLAAVVPEIEDPPPWSNFSVDPWIALSDQVTFTQMMEGAPDNYNLTAGYHLDLDRNEYLIGWRFYPDNLRHFNILSNILYQRALNSTNNSLGTQRIVTSIESFPSLPTEPLINLMWLSFFSAAMCVFPATFAIYVAKERHSSIQAMQLSNGLANPLGLWLGHFLFDSVYTIIVATVISIVYATARDKFVGIGILWLIMCLYGFAATLFAYLVAMLVKSPIGAVSIAVVIQFFSMLLYLTAYIIVIYTRAPTDTPRLLNIVHFTFGLATPINSLIRGAMTSVNQFSLLCDGEAVVKGVDLVAMSRFGAPILYLILWIAALIYTLVSIEIGPGFKPVLSRPSKLPERAFDDAGKPFNPDVAAEIKETLENPNESPLRVLAVSKSFGQHNVVDNVTFSVDSNSVLVMLGPNGAGKTTLLDMIRGHLKPNSGNIESNGVSVISNLGTARLSFGVCPQFTAIDPHLTVREHLVIYGRFKGLQSGPEVQRNVEELLVATGLGEFGDRLACKLSGGNQRRLALAIALIGNPPTILIDEFSTGIDAKMKRELWQMLKHLIADKSVILTTHSMEEATYLASKVGIMSKRLLAIGTPADLESRNVSYEVHFSCSSREDTMKVQQVIASISGARLVDDIATRIAVPIKTHSGDEGVSSVAELFSLLSKQESFMQFTISKSSLETAFIRVLNEGSEDIGPAEDEKLRELDSSV